MKYHLPLLVVACFVIQVQLQIVNNHEYSHVYEECPLIDCNGNDDCSDLEDSTCEPIEVPTEDPTFETTEAPPRKCQCPLEFIRECQSENPTQGKCIPYPDTVNNSRCHNHDHCKNVAVDRNPGLVKCNRNLNTCECTEVAFPVQDPYPVQDAIHDKCIAIIWDMEYPCKIDEQCKMFLNDAECFQNPPAPPQPPTDWYCRCIGGPDKSYLNYTLNKCYKYAEQIGDKCEHVEQCKKYIQGDGEDSDTVECKGVSTLEKTCQCKEDALQLHGYCWKVITDETIPCKIPEQCYSNANATCNDSTSRCDCTTGFVNVDDPSINISCKPVVTEENARCESSLQCIRGMGEYAVCEESFCKCNGTSKYYDAEGQSKCFIPKFMNQLCSDPGECMVGVGSNSRCRNDTGRCDCLTTAIDWEGGCYLPKIVGDQCKSHDECRIPIDGNVKCDQRNKKCACEVDNAPDLGGTVCRPLCTCGGRALV